MYYIVLDILFYAILIYELFELLTIKDPTLEESCKLHEFVADVHFNIPVREIPHRSSTEEPTY
jgi:hypothetical protein